MLCYASRISVTTASGCLLQRSRLRYLGRLIRSTRRPLIALLSAKGADGKPALPWSRLVKRDLDQLYSMVNWVKQLLPDPHHDPDAWYKFMVDEPFQYDALVGSLAYVASVCDKFVPPCSEISFAHVCEFCPQPRPAFKSQRALESHQRIKHGCRSEMRFYADADGICPSCKGCFMTRLRLLAHLVDKRRPKCRNSILSSGTPKLSEQKTHL